MRITLLIYVLFLYTLKIGSSLFVPSSVSFSTVSMWYCVLTTNLNTATNSMFTFFSSSFRRKVLWTFEDSLPIPKWIVYEATTKKNIADLNRLSIFNAHIWMLPLYRWALFSFSAETKRLLSSGNKCKGFPISQSPYIDSLSYAGWLSIDSQWFLSEWFHWTHLNREILSRSL